MSSGCEIFADALCDVRMLEGNERRADRKSVVKGACDLCGA
jgi:hypothetical protein